MDAYLVYMVRTAADKLYTGVSTDPMRRAREHNGSRRGARALRGQRPVQLVWQLQTPLSISQALKLERQIKQLDRSDKELLVKGELSIEQLGSATGVHADR